MSEVDLSGNWRAKAYNMHEQTPKMNPYHGVKINLKEEGLLNPFDPEPNLGPSALTTTMETVNQIKAEEDWLGIHGIQPPKTILGGIRPEDIPLQPTLPFGEDVQKPFPTGSEFMDAIKEAMDRLGLGIAESISMGLEELPDPKPYEVEISLILEQAFQMFLEKNKQYGNAIEYTGVLGAVVAMTGDIARLRVMTLQRSGEPNLSEMLNIRDKLLDILVQAAIGILMLDKDNLKGI